MEAYGSYFADGLGASLSIIDSFLLRCTPYMPPFTLIYFACLFALVTFGISVGKCDWLKQVSLAGATILMLPLMIPSHHGYRRIRTSDSGSLANHSVLDIRSAVSRLFATDPDEALRWVVSTKSCTV